MGCTICYASECDKELECSHSLCYDCYLRLNKSNCPFCRSPFKWTQQDLVEKEKKGIQYEPENPFEFVNLNDDDPSEIIIVTLELIAVEYEPYSRVKRNQHRKRRRDLSFDEVLERRENIRKRIKRSKEHKEGRMRKVKWWEYSNEY